MHKKFRQQSHWLKSREPLTCQSSERWFCHQVGWVGTCRSLRLSLSDPPSERVEVADGRSLCVCACSCFESDTWSVYSSGWSCDSSCRIHTFYKLSYSKSSFLLFVLYIIIQFILLIIINIKFLLICLHTSKLIL